jgi:hypothetical protein
MNVRLKKTFAWYSGVVHDGQFLINHYTAELDLLTITDDPMHQNRAYERMKFWFDEVMDGCIFADEKQDNISQWQDTGARIISLPNEPVDQVIGIMLCLKLNAIMEDRLVVTDVEIWSRAGDSMSYLHNWKESTGPLAQEGWWMDSRPIWTLNRINTVGKVVNLGRSPEWKSHGLDWDTAESDSSSTVVFAKFDNDAKK